jgi:hypothetical protein
LAACAALSVAQTISPAPHTAAMTALMAAFLSLPLVRNACIEISLLRCCVAFFGNDCATVARQRERRVHRSVDGGQQAKNFQFGDEEIGKPGHPLDELGFRSPATRNSSLGLEFAHAR